MCSQTKYIAMDSKAQFIQLSLNLNFKLSLYRGADKIHIFVGLINTNLKIPTAWRRQTR